MPGLWITLEPMQRRGQRRPPDAGQPGCSNAIDIAMWRELQALMLHPLPPAAGAARWWSCGAGRHLSGPAALSSSSRSSASRKRPCATSTRTWSRRRCTMLACDIPLIAQIEGNCIGGGLEIAACCDLRVVARVRFGALIARLAFRWRRWNWRWWRVVPPGGAARDAAERGFSSQSAAAAQHHGLVHAVVA